MQAWRYPEMMEMIHAEKMNARATNPEKNHPGKLPPKHLTSG